MDIVTESFWSACFQDDVYRQNKKYAMPLKRFKREILYYWPEYMSQRYNIYIIYYNFCQTNHLLFILPVGTYRKMEKIILFKNDGHNLNLTHETTKQILHLTFLLFINIFKYPRITGIITCSFVVIEI